MDPLSEPLTFRNLTVKNRVFRSNVSGQFDHYDGSGGDARIQWELKFARGGVGAIISSFVPVSLRGRIAVNYGTIHRDEFIPFWRELGERVQEYDCRFIMQLSHAGRQRDLPTAGYPRGLSSTAKPEQLHGFECDRMTHDDIAMVVREFAEGARRVARHRRRAVDLSVGHPDGARVAPRQSAGNAPGRAERQGQAPQCTAVFAGGPSAGHAGAGVACLSRRVAGK